MNPKPIKLEHLEVGTRIPGDCNVPLGLRNTDVESQDSGGGLGRQGQKNPFDLLRCNKLQPNTHSKCGPWASSIDFT